jgi:hypothetical protein
MPQEDWQKPPTVVLFQKKAGEARAPGVSSAITPR